MAKDPAFLFYTNDFDSGTKFFSDEQVGKFLRLLMAQHQHGHLTEKQVNHICKSYDNEVMEKFVKDSTGNFFNERLENEILRRQSFSESRKANRSGKNKVSKKHIKKKSLSYDYHMENENENENETIIKNEIETDLQKKLKQFFAFRKEIKKPVAESSKESLNKKLMKLSDSNEQKAIEILEQSIANGWQGIFELKTNNNGKQTEAHRINGIRTDNKFAQAIIRTSNFSDSKEGT